MIFASDNSSGVHPSVMDALAKANEGYSPSYGADPVMDQVRQQIRDIFEAPEAAVYLVSTGSTANSLALATCVEPWQSIYCHRMSHIYVDECGAPEFYSGGAKLVGLGGDDGKITATELANAITGTPQGDVHAYQRGAVSITNTTEAGTVYTCKEIASLAKIAKNASLPVHLDGARFANALVSLGCTPAEMTWKAGVDVVSFGGTKNGLMGVEAVIMFNPEKAWEFELRRKRGGHLFSKHRYLSAQMLAYLTDGLWLKLARTANERAARLAEGLRKINNVEISHPVQANMMFLQAPRAKHRRAMEAGAYYYLAPISASIDGPDDEVLAARMICSWSTTEADVDQLVSLFGE